MDELRWDNEKDFAKSIKELLIYRGFKINSYYDDIGPDGGRDIEAQTFEYDHALDRKETVNWWIELKFRSKTSLGVKDINDICSKISRAALNKIDKFLLITNAQFTPDFKKSITACAEENHIKLRCWDKTILENLFFNKQNEKDIKDFHTNLISDRVEDTKLIFNLIEGGLKPVIFLVGSAGVGKSALARYILSYMSNSDGYSGGVLDMQLQGGIGLQLKVLANILKKRGYKSDFCFSSDLQVSENQRLELLFDHCCSHKTILIVDNLEKQLNPSGNIGDWSIKTLVERFLSQNMNGSVLLLLSRVPLNCNYNANPLCFTHELKGWDIDFVYEKYLPYLQHLNTRLSNIASENKRKQLLKSMEGNPLALNIANYLCTFNKLEVIVNCIKDKHNPAQNLIRLVSEELKNEEIEALNRFAQFNRPMSKNEIIKYVCSESVLKSLQIRQLIESIADSDNQYGMHPLIVAQFDLQNDIERRKEIVTDISSKILHDLKQVNIEEVYNHGLLRQVAEMFLSIDEVNQAAEIIIRIGTRALSMGDVDYLTNILHRLYGAIDLSALNRTRLKKTEGHIYDFENRYDKAAKVYGEMLQESIKLQDSWSRAAALNGLGSIERFNNNCEKAISLYTESLQIRIDHNLVLDQSNSHHNLGAVYIIMQEYDKAIEHLEKAKDIRQKQNDIFRVSATELYLGECYTHTGDYEKAETLLKECIENKEKVHDVVGNIWANLAMAKLIVCETGKNFSAEKLKSNIDTMNQISVLCKNIAHMKECVMAQIFMSMCKMMLQYDLQDIIETLVKARNYADQTMLSEYYNKKITDLMRMVFDEKMDSDDIRVIKQIALQLKI